MKKTKYYEIKYIKKILPLFIIIFLLIIGTSLALWQITLKQESTNIVTTGCLKLTLTEQTNAIVLSDAIPISDEDGKMLPPYTFTIENTCNTLTNYVINLETIRSETAALEDKYVKANLVSMQEDEFLDTLTDNNINLEKVITEASNAYKLYQGVLASREQKQFSLRLWIDEETDATDEVMNKTWQGKITITGKFIPMENVKNVMKKIDVVVDEEYFGWGMWSRKKTNATYTNNKKYNLTKIVYQEAMNPYESATEVIDLSVAQDKSVLGYYVKDKDVTDTDKYILYIQADGKIKVNPEAENFFFYYYNDYDSNDKVTVSFEGVENLDTSSIVDMSYMFNNCSLESIDLSNFDTSGVTDMSYMFYNANNLTNLDLSSFDTSKVEKMNDMFFGCSSLTSLNLSSFNTKNVMNMSYMFYDCNNLTTLNLDNFDTANVQEMNAMFQQCNNLTNLSLNSFNTSRITDMSYMFTECNSLTNLDLGNFDTSNVEIMFAIFSGCSSLTSLDLSNFSTNKVIDMSDMFSGCGSLTSLNLSSFNTSNVETMSAMFYSCSSLTSLDLSNFVTNKVTTMEAMFNNCSSLTNLDLSNFDTSSVELMNSMFNNCTSLTNIVYGQNFIYANEADATDMFLNCKANKPSHSSWSNVTY